MFAQVVIGLEKAIADAEVTDIPMLVAELERAKALAWAKLVNGMRSQGGPQVNDQPLWGIPQVAEYLNIPVSRAYELARYQDGLPTIRLGKSLRVSPTELTAWLGQQKKGLDNGLCQRHS